MKRVDTYLARLFIVVISIVITLVLIEIVATIYLWNMTSEDTFKIYASVDQIKARYGEDFYTNPETDKLYRAHHYLGYYPQPNYSEGLNQHNTLGFRGEEIMIPKPDDVYRIVAIGGSTTYSTSVEDWRDSYPAQLETYLKAQGYTNIEVVNAGASGYTSYENLINLQFRILPLEPDLIIVYQGLNDVHARLVYPAEAYLSDNSGYRTISAQPVNIPSILEYSNALRIFGINLGWFDSQSALETTISERASTSQVRAFRNLMRANRADEFVLGDLTMMELFDLNAPIPFEANTRSMVLIAKGNNMDVLLVTPTSYIGFDGTYSSTALYQRGYDEHAEKMEKVAIEQGVGYYDIRTAFPNDSLYYTDDRHMTKEGNGLRAQLIGDILIETILPVS